MKKAYVLSLGLFFAVSTLVVSVGAQAQDPYNQHMRRVQQLSSGSHCLGSCGLPSRKYFRTWGGHVQGFESCWGSTQTGKQWQVESAYYSNGVSWGRYNESGWNIKFPSRPIRNPYFYPGSLPPNFGNLGGR